MNGNSSNSLSGCVKSDATIVAPLFFAYILG